MKCLIIYYSLTNATAQIAENITIGLQKSCFQVKLCNIKDEPHPDLQEFDMLGVGTPVYYVQIPINMLECLETLSNTINMKAFVFMTNSSYAWNAGDMLKEEMARHGLSISGWFQCYGTGYFLPYIKQGCLVSPGHPTAQDLERARQFGYDMGTGSGESIWIEKTNPPPVMYRLEQKLTKRVMIRRIYQRLFYLNKKKCTKCGICIKGCPTQNITRDAEGFPKWNKTCIMCLSCESRCPQEAILSPVSWSIMKPLIRYNVKKILDNPRLDKVKAQHHNGKIDAL
jgi:flavodoxin/NAD-dependent dihydropyrimidine dehydrogenase PreA subunit